MRGEERVMQARGALMIEHRLIERVVALIEAALVRIDAIDTPFVDAVVDFIRTYADRTHHGKEEDILFRELDRRDLSSEDRRFMSQLLADHVLGRKTTKTLADAGSRYCAGDGSALAEIKTSLEALVELYPQHIEKEDKIFFPASRSYLSDEEDQAMLREFWEFDRRIIHEKYKAVVAALGS
jgi:hemerythrin-like domain-containing protein